VLIASNDTPSSPIVALKYIERTDYFESFLMFKPIGTDSIWVSLKRLDWMWTGTAEMTNNNWNVTWKDSLIVNNGVGFEIVDLPEWQGNYKKLSYIPIS
jgi:hypothetical protein